MYKRILVPLDGSELAEQVLPYAQLLSKVFDGKIELIRVLDIGAQDLAEVRDGLGHYRQVLDFQDRVHTYMREVAGRLGDDSNVSWMALEGDPATVILANAEKDPDTLIAMCNHGRSGITRWGIGEVADKVLHAATNPLLVVPSGGNLVAAGDPSPQQITVTLDGSPAAEQILPYVASLATGLNLSVTLVTVTPSPDDEGLLEQSVFGPEVGYRSDLDDRATAYLHKISEVLGSQGVAGAEGRLLHGHPAAAIVGLAWESSNAWLAMAAQGRHATRWYLGSVTDRVVQHAGVPVLVTRESQAA